MGRRSTGAWTSTATSLASTRATATSGAGRAFAGALGPWLHAMSTIEARTASVESALRGSGGANIDSGRSRLGSLRSQSIRGEANCPAGSGAARTPSADEEEGQRGGAAVIAARMAASGALSS